MAKRRTMPSPADCTPAITLPSDLSPSLELAIGKHAAAVKGIEMLVSKVSDETFNALVAAETTILHELTKARCANDDEFFAKIAYLLEVDCDFVGHPNYYADFGCPLALAIEEYLEQRLGRRRGQAETEGRAA